RTVITRGRCRVVRYPALDVYHDTTLRVVQVVTSLQRGGAERIALTLARELGSCGVHPLLVALGSPTRTPFLSPPGTVDLARTRGDRRARIEALARTAIGFGADLVHGHLLDGPDIAWLAA